MVIALTDPIAAGPDVAGAKAANIARLAVLGLPVVEGFVITTAGIAEGIDSAAVHGELIDRWRRLGGDVNSPLVVRSSSTVEDAASSSMAGRFTSILDVRGWEALTTAVSAVVESGRAVDERAPMAVLVQRQVSARVGGVLFGADPVDGRLDRIVVEWVDGRPDSLVSGRSTAAHAALTRHGRLVRQHAVMHRAPSGAASAPSRPTTPLPSALPYALRRRLADIARTTEVAFGHPQDLEWAVDMDGSLWVLQSRPVTALHQLPPGHHARLGRGPVAETFPHPLSRLEADLWVEPLRNGLMRALRATGAVTEQALQQSAVATTVADWMVVDLDLVEGDRSGRLRRLVSPRRVVRRLSTAWRVGRLRAALPTLAAIVVESADEHLAAVSRVGTQRDDELVDLLRRSRHELATVHSYEMLAGMLLDSKGAVPMPMLAMRALHEAREEEIPDGEIAAARPEVLSLIAPSIVAQPSLPEHGVRSSHMAPEGTTVDDLSLRDALRLRVRWLHELQCRAAREIGHRAEMRGTLPAASAIAQLSLDEVDELCRSSSIPVDFGVRQAPDASRSLPAAFTLAVDGTVIPLSPGRIGVRSGVGAGGGRGMGPSVDVTRLREIAASATSPEHSDSGNADAHDTAINGRPVLVTEFLEPALAPLLPLLAGVVAESGSVLSHLAILAREYGVPCVVAVPDARRRFPPGTPLTVDGGTGVVEVADDIDRPNDHDRPHDHDRHQRISSVRQAS
ncbi:MAG: Phosphoenolpyruvate synthase/pyruvate phosphate dikinase [Actinomycetota bacterium]